jgi:hypothetical protein
MEKIYILATIIRCQIYPFILQKAYSDPPAASLLYGITCSIVSVKINSPYHLLMVQAIYTDVVPVFW